MDRPRRAPEADFRRRTPLTTGVSTTVSAVETGATRASGDSTFGQLVWRVLARRWHFVTASVYLLVRLIARDENATSLGALVGPATGFLLVWGVCYGLDALVRLAYAGWRRGRVTHV